MPPTTNMHENMKSSDGYGDNNGSDDDGDTEILAGSPSVIAAADHHRKPFTIDGQSLSVHDLCLLGRGGHRLALTNEAWRRVEESRAVIDELFGAATATATTTTVYGINTGFGQLANVRIPNEKLCGLQENLIRSTAAGVGAPLSVERTRMLLALRINVLAKGRSGIRPCTLRSMLDAFNNDCLSRVPEKGTVGASGDLAPLAHLALGLMGEGEMWNSKTSRYEPAADVLMQHKLEPIHLTAKEGLAMINGTQFIASLGAEAVCRAENCAFVADVVGAFSLEVLRGTPVAFDSKIHADRPHAGQMASAERVRRLVGYGEGTRSALAQSHYHPHQMQDAYSLRCLPQVHGIASDTITFVKQILTTELNSATDNPMIFAETKQSLSGGNFHGEYPAKALDFLAIGVHELASISERRIERLVNPVLSTLPAFLTPDGGFNSGFMIAHCTAAALVSENKVLTHPSSVDSISTSASTEDHVSMGGYSARKSLQVIEHVEQVLAIELMCACQALDLLRPLTTATALERVWSAVRHQLGVKRWDRDRVVTPDIERITEWIRSGELRAVVESFCA